MKETIVRGLVKTTRVVGIEYRATLCLLNKCMKATNKANFGHSDFIQANNIFQKIYNCGGYCNFTDAMFIKDFYNSYIKKGD